MPKHAATRKPSSIRIAPQLAVLVDRPPAGSDWIHEIKYDGYRTLVVMQNGRVQFLTRNGLDWTHRYTELATIAKKLKIRSAIFDGEIAALDDSGRSDFGRLQAALKDDQSSGFVYYVFDCLELNGRDLRNEPLLERKKKLKQVLAKVAGSSWIYSEHFEEAHLLREACRAGLEGVVSKLKTAPYHEGRSDVWRKSKCGNEQEFVIVGYTTPKGTRERFGAVLLAVREGRRYRYVGRVGTGFSSNTLKELHTRFECLEAEVSAVSETVPEGNRVQWLKPQLVAQIKFAGWTPDGHLRHAVFLGLREDKAAKQVRAEKPTATDSNPAACPRISHPDRKVFPGVTKKDLAIYYEKVAPRLLKFAAGRPLSLLRCPEGAAGQCFFQKHLDGEALISASEERDLIQFVQMGAIEIHSANVHLNKPRCPDMIVFDLDPGPRVSWTQVIEGAFAIKETLEQIGLKSFVKLTGGKGVHIHVTVTPRYTSHQIRAFAKAIVENLAHREPRLYLIKMTKSERVGRIFLDYFRNNEGATAVAPYSVRARGRGTIALPVPWSKLKPDLHPDSILIENFELPTDPWRGLQAQQTIRLLEYEKPTQ